MCFGLDVVRKTEKGIILEPSTSWHPLKKIDFAKLACNNYINRIRITGHGSSLQ